MSTMDSRLNFQKVWTTILKLKVVQITLKVFLSKRKVWTTILKLRFPRFHQLHRKLGGNFKENGWQPPVGIRKLKV